jgi:hypothetical protein
VLAPPRYILGSRVKDRLALEQEETIVTTEERMMQRMQAGCQVVVTAGGGVGVVWPTPTTAEATTLPATPAPTPPSAPWSSSSSPSDDLAFTRRLVTLCNGVAPAAQRCEAGAALLSALERRVLREQRQDATHAPTQARWWLVKPERTLLLHHVYMVGEGLAALVGGDGSVYPSRLLRRYSQQHAPQLSEAFSRELLLMGTAEDADQGVLGEELALRAAHAAALVEQALVVGVVVADATGAATRQQQQQPQPVIVNVHTSAAAHTTSAASTNATASATAPTQPASSSSSRFGWLAVVWAAVSAGGGTLRAVAAVLALLRDTVLKLLLFRGAVLGARSAVLGARVGGGRRGKEKGQEGWPAFARGEGEEGEGGRRRRGEGQRRNGDAMAPWGGAAAGW